MAEEVLLSEEKDDEETPIASEDGADGADVASSLNKKKRLCRHPGCTKVIKSQGHCQRHGAKAKRCKIDGCDKQAQGTHDGMCKRHWKALHCPDSGKGGNGTSAEEILPPAPEGDSIYDSVLPQSISYRPTLVNKASLPDLKPGEDPPPPPNGVSVMPLVDFLRDGALRKEPGWHRNAERRARGLFPMSNLSTQLEPWERQLALVEILLLSGGTPYANFKDLAHAWGREKGFHHVLASNVCERRGEVERKRRSDAGRAMSEEQKESLRNKVKRSRVAAHTSLMIPDTSTAVMIQGAASMAPPPNVSPTEI